MDFVTAIKTCLRKYADFSGRAARPECWYFALFFYGGLLVLRLIYWPLAVIFYLAIVWPYLAVVARRLQDTGRSGWLVLLGLVPIVGVIVLIVWCCQRGELIPNQYGMPPSWRRRRARAAG